MLQSQLEVILKSQCRAGALWRRQDRDQTQNDANRSGTRAGVNTIIIIAAVRSSICKSNMIPGVDYSRLQIIGLEFVYWRNSQGELKMCCLRKLMRYYASVVERKDPTQGRVCVTVHTCYTMVPYLTLCRNCFTLALPTKCAR